MLAERVDMLVKRNQMILVSGLASAKGVSGGPRLKDLITRSWVAQDQNLIHKSSPSKKNHQNWSSNFQKKIRNLQCKGNLETPSLNHLKMSLLCSSGQGVSLDQHHLKWTELCQSRQRKLKERRRFWKILKLICKLWIRIKWWNQEILLSLKGLIKSKLSPSQSLNTKEKSSTRRFCRFKCQLSNIM